MSHLTTHLTKRQSWFTLFVTVFLAFVLWLSLPVSGTVRSMGGVGTGPGGVGATDGSGTLEVWYQSDKTVYSDDTCTTSQTTDNGAVACWPDHSGNSVEAIQSTSTNQPTFQNASGDTLNGHPMLRWDGNDILVTNSNVPFGSLTIFLVYNASGDGYLYHHTVQSPPNNGSYIYTQNGASYSVRRSTAEDFEDLPANWGLNATPRIITQRYNGTAVSHNFYINGLLQTPTLTQTNNAGTVQSNAVFSIGGRAVDGALRITGNYAEVIAYNDYLNVAQRVLVENYLQAKYNDSVANNISISNDRYDGDTTANGDFDLDVAGIGRATSTEMHTEAHSAGMIVQNDTFLQDDGDYLMFGHLTPTNSNVDTDLPGGWGVDARRWERHWYVDVTDVGGNTGTVNIIFDFSEAGMGNGSNPVGPLSNYRLLGRSGTSGDFAEIVSSASSISGDQVIFSGVSVSLLGSNFTLGSLDAVTSPTAVQIQSAAATIPASSWFIMALVLFTLGVSAVVMVARGRKA